MKFDKILWEEHGDYLGDIKNDEECNIEKTLKVWRGDSFAYNFYDLSDEIILLILLSYADEDILKTNRI